MYMLMCTLSPQFNIRSQTKIVKACFFMHNHTGGISKGWTPAYQTNKQLLLVCYSDNNPAQLIDVQPCVPNPVLFDQTQERS